ncbi:MAG: sensor histidine kinase [Methanoregula sp.]|uniref:sensor histidine kinase n=1 Tax=Methanoregula sp. TaxID=2052170 RepID=UPI003BB08A0C
MYAGLPHGKSGPLTAVNFSLNDVFMRCFCEKGVREGFQRSAGAGTAQEERFRMTTVNSIDISVAVNLLMCVGIVLVSVWGYYRIRKITPLYFGCAYTLFAISHFLLLNGGENPPGPEFFVLRTTGYAFVVIGLFAILRDIIRKTEAEADLARLTGRLEERVLERTAELAQANDALITEVCQRAIAEERLRQSLHEKDVLIKEIHHRVKNNLQVIVSLLYLQSRKTGDPACAAALLDSQTRVKSMALIHENLYQSGDLASIDFDRYLRNLAGNLRVAYGVDRAGIRVITDVRDLNVSLTTAIPLGLIANELIANALKYAFTGRDGGEITLAGEKDASQITLIVKDNGRGIPEDLDWENAESLGFNLVRMLVRQLKGTVRLDRTGGTQFVITLPYAG